jgi:hypothetical protein
MICGVTPIPRSDENKFKLLEEYKVYYLEKLLVLKQSCLQGISCPRQNVSELENGSDAFLMYVHNVSHNGGRRPPSLGPSL